MAGTFGGRQSSRLRNEYGQGERLLGLLLPSDRQIPLGGTIFHADEIVHQTEHGNSRIENARMVGEDCSFRHLYYTAAASQGST